MLIAPARTGSTEPPRFHLFFSVSISGSVVTFTANADCGGGKYQAGVWLARDTGGASWATEMVAGVCGYGSTRFQAVSSAVLEGDTLAFVGLQISGQEGIFKMNISQPAAPVLPVVVAGAAAPRIGGRLVSFPQPPSVYAGEVMFRAYTDDGETGLFHSNRGGTLSTLVSTKDMLEPGRDTVYIGAGQSAFGADGAYAFYASTTNVSNKDGYDGIYLGRRSMGD